MLVQQQQLLGHRAGQLALVCAAFLREDGANALHVFLETALAVGCPAPAIDWRALDYSDVVQAEAARGIAIGQRLAQWQETFRAAATPNAALAALAQALPGQAQLEGDRLTVSDTQVFTYLLSAPPQDLPTPAQSRLARLAVLCASTASGARARLGM